MYEMGGVILIQLYKTWHFSKIKANCVFIMLIQITEIPLCIIPYVSELDAKEQKVDFGYLRCFRWYEEASSGRISYDPCEIC